MNLETKVHRLQQILRECGSVCIGYSGGVDSVYLACMAVDTLGSDCVLAVTGRSAAYPAVQHSVALDCARRFGIPHIEIETDELSDPNYAANPANRCYYCKAELWPKLHEVARQRDLRTVLDGSNADDAHDYRPGFAAAQEHAVRSPLLEAGLTKDDIRELSRSRGLPTWDQPSAPCLSSRLPYGVAVTPARLRQVEVAETLLRDLGFVVFRVRHHDDAMRIEVAPDELPAAEAHAHRIAAAFMTHELPVPLLDAEGYRRGALNEVLVRIDGPRGGARRPDAGATRDIALPDHEVAGHHRDICVLNGYGAADARDLAAAARAAGFRYVAVRLEPARHDAGAGVACA